MISKLMNVHFILTIYSNCISAVVKRESNSLLRGATSTML